MIWLTWRQFRPQAIAAAGALAVAAILLAVTRPGLGAAYKASGLAACHTNCQKVVSDFLSNLSHPDTFLFLITTLVIYLTPLLMGLLWGAPLVSHEFAAGTHRLAWNQGVTRTRWVAVKLSVVGLAAIATAGLLSLMVTWWASPIDRALNLSTASVQAHAGPLNGSTALGRLDPLMFDARGVAPLGYAAFAFALGVTAGVLIGKALPAMTLTLVVFVAIQILMPNLVRPHLLPPAHRTTPVTLQSINLSPSSGSSGYQLQIPENFDRAGAWVLSDIIITGSGKQPSDITTTTSGAELTNPPAACIPAAGPPNESACRAAVNALHLRQLVTYQPASRFWPLQWLEMGIYLVLAALLGLVCTWRVRRGRA